MAYELPANIFERYTSYAGNGQSQLLQRVRIALLETYSSTMIRADGQVVVVPFLSVTFEVLPAFLQPNGSYKFPDANNGGSWETCHPRKEISAMNLRDQECYGNLKRLCRIGRIWKARNAVPVSSMLLDTLAFNFMGKYEHRDKGFAFYDWICRDFFRYMADQSRSQMNWVGPGGVQYVERTGPFERYAETAHILSTEAIAHENQGRLYSASVKWKEIFGSKFP